MAIDTKTISTLTKGCVDVLPEGMLGKRLEEAEARGRQLRVKLGVDPTAPDIHLGHTVVLTKLRQFQDAGHLAVLIIGDYTARIGDPSGASKTRPQLPPEIIEANARTYQEQAWKVLDQDHSKLELRKNSEWLSPMRLEDIFRLLSSSTVARILERDDFANRLSAGQAISMLEFLYPLLQGYDSVAVDADIELGGTDQKFNMLMGRVVQEYYGKPPQVVITNEILPGTDGEQRMSKSVGNYIGVNEPADEIFGKVMSIPDSAMITYYRLLTSRPLDDIGAMEQGLANGSLHPRDLKAALAGELVARFHGQATAEAAQRHFDEIFRDKILTANAALVECVLEPGDNEHGLVYLPKLLERWFGLTRSEARRRIQQGGVFISDRQVLSEKIGFEGLDGATLKAGKSVKYHGIIRAAKQASKGPA
ncbi:MAG: tyrosine--tRNA ligase [Thermoleophilia bacterium]|nr:tyrosine--tRNA ligase [Thermoleophilia bacterium]